MRSSLEGPVLSESQGPFQCPGDWTHFPAGRGEQHMHCSFSGEERVLLGLRQARPACPTLREKGDFLSCFVFKIE